MSLLPSFPCLDLLRLLARRDCKERPVSIIVTSRLALAPSLLGLLLLLHDGGAGPDGVELLLHVAVLLPLQAPFFSTG